MSLRAVKPKIGEDNYLNRGGRGTRGSGDFNDENPLKVLISVPKVQKMAILMLS